MLKLHGYYYCCLLALFAFACLFFVSLLQPYARDVALIYDSLCLSRSCLASFRCLAVSACVCVSRSFSAFFVCRTEGVPVFICQTAPILQQLLCSMLKLHGRFLPIYVFGAFAYQV